MLKRHKEDRGARNEKAEQYKLLGLSHIYGRGKGAGVFCPLFLVLCSTPHQVSHQPNSRELFWCYIGLTPIPLPSFLGFAEDLR